MKNEYDFSKGKRGAVVKPRPGKTRITIRLDDDVLQWFRDQVHAMGGGNYQTLINDALRHVMSQEYEPLDETVRRVVREEMAKYGAARQRPRPAFALSDRCSQSVADLIASVDEPATACLGAPS